MCLSAPAPAALSLPDWAVCSGHMQLLWDLLSPAWMCQLGSGPRLSLQPICNWCHHLSVAPVAFLKPLIWQGHYTASCWASKRKGRVQPEYCECRLHFFSFKEQFLTSDCHWMVPKASPAVICLLPLDAAWELTPDLAPGFQRWSVSPQGHGQPCSDVREGEGLYFIPPSF